MNFQRAAAVANAVLLEGYVLYPYRATSTKNRYRWTFGVLAPRSVSESRAFDPWWLEAQVPVEGEALHGRLRFLRVVERTVLDAQGRPVERLEIGDRTYLPWEEGELVEIDFTLPIASDEELEVPVVLEATEEREDVGAGTVVRRRAALDAVICARISRETEPVRAIVRVENVTPFDPDAERAVAVRAALASTHLLLGVERGRFFSVVDPPMHARGAVSCCVNENTHPVTVGDDVMLCAPIILYDDPKIAPESEGDFCDATEIDEMLVLRTMTLAPHEKALARATDARSAEIVDRAERTSAASFAKMHGAVRDRAPLTCGTRVRLRASGRRTDAQDVLYEGCSATIEKVMRDVDGRDCYAVTFEGDPAAELHRWYGRFHYYYADEVEPLEGEEAAS